MCVHCISVTWMYTHGLCFTLNSFKYFSGLELRKLYNLVEAHVLYIKCSTNPVKFLHWYSQQDSILDCYDCSVLYAKGVLIYFHILQ